VGGVVFADEPAGVGAHDFGDCPDVPARVEVATAGIEIILLDGPDQARPDASARTDVRDGQSRAVPRPG
jgi:hypothetical protein